MDKVYDPQKYEADIYKQWEEAGAFKPQGEGEPFCIIMPPPNANGELHWGHAIGYSTEDVITRFKRMQGYKTLWFPGTDHAGIETQFVYERDVLKPQGKSRFDLGADKFYAEVMKFTRQKQQNILDSFRSMGFSADWSKLKFTLDPDIIDIVHDTFIQMHKDGHVYRGNRIVNWCTRCSAAFADIELEHAPREDSFYTLDYGPLQIATTRPETIFADVALAVNPKDSRYKNLGFKEAIVPLVNRPVPIITDPRVDPETGTGALKVTPGHDPTDYEIGQKHKLPQISIIDPDGKMINVPDEFAGLSVAEARTATVAALKKAGKLIEEQTIKHAVAIHDRCGTVIEPLISEQWFLRIKKLNQPVIAAIKSDAVRFFPARYKKVALDWLAQEHDWCISRQIWWGIRMPIYYKTSHDQDKEPYLIAKSEDEAKAYYGEGKYRTETDTFDTWFSSGQWPYATLMTSGDFEQFYPTALMGTAREILHKWVTRMLMFGLYRTGEVPFRDVYLWGLVTDEHGQKMSKSKGNVIDPALITAKYGTDALRLAGTISNTPGNDSPMAESRVVAMRNFVNKLWNVARFVISKVEADKTEAKAKPDGLIDEWLLHQLHTKTTKITKLLEEYRLNEAANQLYHLLWDDFADWYLETSKLRASPAVLLYGLEVIVKLAHPFIPFVSEAIWSQLPRQQGQLITAPWPQAGKLYPKAASDFEQLRQLIGEVRTTQTELELGPVPLYYKDSGLIKDHAELIQKLAKLSAVEKVKDGRGLPLISGKTNSWLGVGPEIVGAYQTKLNTKLIESQKYAESLRAKLANKGFKESAPEEVVKATAERLEAAEEQVKYITEQLERLP